MAKLLTNRLRAIMGALCVALALMFVSGSIINTIDSVQHAAQIPHNHGTLALTQIDDDHHDPALGAHHDDDDDDHHDTISAHHDDDHDAGQSDEKPALNDHGGAAHHHHSDGQGAFLVAVVPENVVTDLGRNDGAPVSDKTARSLAPPGLERPPRA